MYRVPSYYWMYPEAQPGHPIMDPLTVAWVLQCIIAEFQWPGSQLGKRENLLQNNSEAHITKEKCTIALKGRTWKNLQAYCKMHTLLQTFNLLPIHLQIFPGEQNTCLKIFSKTPSPSSPPLTTPCHILSPLYFCTGSSPARTPLPFLYPLSPFFDLGFHSA